MTDRKKPGVAFWATVVAVVALTYALSIGPVVWFGERDFIPGSAIPAVRFFYWPIIWLAVHDDGPVGETVQSYVDLWRPQ